MRTACRITDSKPTPRTDTLPLCSRPATSASHRPRHTSKPRKPSAEPQTQSPSNASSPLTRLIHSEPSPDKRPINTP